MAIPKPKPDSILDEEDWIDIKRTEITLKHRMAARREKNDLYRLAIELRREGKKLAPKKLKELPGGTAE